MSDRVNSNESFCFIDLISTNLVNFEILGIMFWFKLQLLLFSLLSFTWKEVIDKDIEQWNIGRYLNLEIVKVVVLS